MCAGRRNKEVTPICAGGVGGSGSKNNLKNLNVICCEIANENPIVFGYGNPNGFDECIAPEFCEGFAVWRKDLHSLIAAIGDIEVVPAIQGNLGRLSELSKRRAFAAPDLDEIGAEVVLLDAVVARVDDIDVSIGIDGDVE